MIQLKMARAICSIFPPVIAQQLRNYIFPIRLARKIQLDFSKKSITGSVFRGNTADYHSYRFAINGYFEWRNIIMADYFLENKSGDIIEIGANVGTETISYCDVTKKKGTVHAFEPLPQNIEDLKILKNGIPNFKLYHHAISDKEMTVSFKKPPITSSGTGKIVLDDHLAADHELMKVAAAPLDKFIDSFQAVRFMSIDTEGHEPFVLAGSIKTIEKFRPAIVIEVSPNLLKKYANSSNRDIFDFFTARDYVCLKVNTFSLSDVNDHDINDTKANNWLCVPRESAAIKTDLSRRLWMRTVIPWYLLKSLKR